MHSRAFLGAFLMESSLFWVFRGESVIQTHDSCSFALRVRARCVCISNTIPPVNTWPGHQRIVHWELHGQQTLEAFCLLQYRPFENAISCNSKYSLLHVSCIWLRPSHGRYTSLRFQQAHCCMLPKSTPILPFASYSYYIKDSILAIECLMP